MIDDDYSLEEGDVMPDPWWRLPEDMALTVRYRSSTVAGLPLFSNEFYGASLSVYGPRYLNLRHLTRHATRPGMPTPRRHAFNTLTAAFPDTFSTVIAARGPHTVWLALRLTHLTHPITDLLLHVHAATLTAPAAEPNDLD